MIKEAIATLVRGDDLTEAGMIEAMEEIMEGRATQAQIGSFITALRMKGEKVDEISGAAMVMRAKAEKIAITNHREDETILDTCGTGGDSVNTFNVSTVTAFVAAGGGVKVAKHGNRAVSSQCGSADVLEALGLKLDVSRSTIERCIEEVGIGFLFAPLFHAAMKHAAGPRREIGLRTVFNMLGPLTNPAGATAQLLGVYDPDLTEKMAHVLVKLGTKEAFVVCGEGTFDEISICGKTKVSHLRHGEINTFDMTPEDYGFKRADPEAVKGGSAQENVRAIMEIMEGHKGPRRDMVLLNAGAAFVAAGLDGDLRAGIARGQESIDSGRAKGKLNALIDFARRCS